MAAAMDTRIVVEEGITHAREINISVMGNAGHDLECSVCEEVFHEGSEFLEFKDKYLTGFRTIPAKIDKKISDQIQRDLLSRNQHDPRITQFLHLGEIWPSLSKTFEPSHSPCSYQTRRGQQTPNRFCLTHSRKHCHRWQTGIKINVTPAHHSLGARAVLFAI